MVEIPSGWERIKIGEIAEVVGGGTPSTKVDGNFGGDIPWITPKDLASNPRRYTQSGERTLTRDGLASSSAKLLPSGSVLISSRAPIGLVTIAKGEVATNQGFRSLILRPGYLPEFIYYRIVQSHPDLIAAANGTTFMEVSGSSLKEVEVLVPPIAEQRAIASVLGALDDKIEANRRLIAVVAALSEASFQAWRSSISDWLTTTFGSFAEVFGGATPKTSEDEYWNGEIAWATPSDVTALDSMYMFDTVRHITREGLASSSTQLHPPGTIFMTSRATIGAFAINQVPCAPNQGFIVVRPPEQIDRWFLLHEMSRRVQEMIDRANGTTFMELSRGSFKEMDLLVPANRDDVASLYSSVDPLHGRAAKASCEQIRLTSLRDALLPELLSGRLRVRDAESFLEDEL